MSKKHPYKVISPIRRDGKLYKPGQLLELTEERAAGLHVELVGEAADLMNDKPKPAPKKSGRKPKPQTP